MIDHQTQHVLDVAQKWDKPVFSCVKKISTDKWEICSGAMNRRWCEIDIERLRARSSEAEFKIVSFNSIAEREAMLNGFIA